MKVKLYLPGKYEAIALAQEATRTKPGKLALNARGDLAKFGEYISGYRPAEHHEEWLAGIVTGQDSQALSMVAGANLRIAAPRNAAKTTWTAIALAWIIGHNPAIRIILVSYSKDIALAIGVYVRNIVASDRYRDVFPHVYPSRKWSDGAWFINRAMAGIGWTIKDPTLLSVGVGGSIASRRSDLIVIDDPIRSSLAIANPAIRMGMITWWFEVLEPTLDPGGRVFCSCTRYRIDDIHGTTFNEANNWTVITQRAIMFGDDGKERSYWPERFTLEELQVKRDRNPRSFASQYQNNPVADDVAIVKSDSIKRSHPPARFESIAIGVDLASSRKNSADYSAFVVVGKVEGKFYTLSATRGRWTISEICDRLIDVHDRFIGQTRHLTIQIEAVQFQAALALEVKRVAILRGRNMVIENVIPKGDKEQRLRSVVGVLEVELHWFSIEEAMDILINELLYFGSISHDDLADAWYWAIAKLLKARKPMSRE